MPAYSYTAINKVGTKKKGIISAISEREARKLVKDLNLTPLKISESKNLGKTLKDLIHNNASENEISDYVFKDNQSIDKASIDLIVSGVTSCEEIIRVNNIKEDASI